MVINCPDWSQMALGSLTLELSIWNFPFLARLEHWSTEKFLGMMSENDHGQFTVTVTVNCTYPAITISSSWDKIVALCCG